MLNEDQRRQAADALFQAEKSAKPITQLSTTYPEITLEDSYAIQSHWMDKRVKAGARIVGHKIGLTSRAMQMASEMNEPDYGILLDDMLYNDGATIEAARFNKPRIEVELAFVLGQALRGPGIRVHDVLRATDFVTPAMEIIDHRTITPRRIFDNIADNAGAAAMVMGGRVIRPFDSDLRWIGATLSQGATIEETGLAAGVMGHPAAGIAWLVNKLALLGGGLEPGHIVLAGSFTRTVAVRPGDVFTANFGPHGALAVSFS